MEDNILREIGLTENETKVYLALLEINYFKAPYFETYYPEIKKIISKNHSKLSDLNIKLLLFLLSCFGLENKKIIKASEINLPEVSGGSSVVFEICKTINANTYLSGSSGPDYLELEDFEKSGITIEVHNFKHPTYTQQYKPFIPCMSSIDLLFNHGPKSLEIITQNNIKSLSQ